MMTEDERYPALLLDWLTPFYDLFIKLLIPERRFKRELLTRAELALGHRVLDLGAGSGTLAIMIKQAQPKAQVIGLDGDAEILAIAWQKAERAGVEISLEQGDVTELPYSGEAFDRVISSLVMSLLKREDKHRALREAYRVLRPGGQLHLGDFGAPYTKWGRRVSPLMRRFDRLRANLNGHLSEMIREAGFEDVAEAAHFGTVFGTLVILSGRKAT